MIGAATLGVVAMLQTNPAQCVKASYYDSGPLTANGERFVPLGFTAAHRTLPFGTLLRVTYPKTQRSVVVRINDRGPFITGRDLDLSLGAAATLGLTERQGVDTVCYDIVSPVTWW